MMHGFEIAGTFTEKAVSGGKSSAARTEGARVLKTMRQGDILIAAELDRAFRVQINHTGLRGVLEQQADRASASASD